jgi:hypothetical protein
LIPHNYYYFVGLSRAKGIHAFSTNNKKQKKQETKDACAINSFSSKRFIINQTMELTLEGTKKKFGIPGQQL